MERATAPRLAVPSRPHPRRITWVGASALALGGSNQSIFLIGSLLAAQGSAAVPLLAAGLLLAYLATPGWIELSCMFPDRVGGIAATCAEAFRPYSAVLANLTGVCYWWGWVPTCGLTAIFSADAIHQWYLPGVSTTLLATLLVVGFAALNLCGLKWAVRVAKPVALVAALLAFGTALIPVLAGTVDWHQALSFHLDAPFHGAFGKLTSAMAGLYLIGFAAPAFEAAACHIGEMKVPAKDQPRAMWTSGAMASIYFVVIPVVWLGVFGSARLEGDLATLLGPTFAPLSASLAKAAAIWFITFNMFCGTIQPLSGASRTLAQLSEDGLLPRSVGYRMTRTDAPAVAIVITAGASIGFLLLGDPTSLVAAANLTYLIGIALPSVAAWVLRRNEPDRERPYRAHRWSIRLGVVAAIVWLATTMLGFEQFGLPYVIFGLALAYSGSIFYAWRVHQDRKVARQRGPRRSLHLKLTGAMLAVLTLDGAGYLLAVSHAGNANPELVALLKDIFVTVGILTITVGLVLPGMIAHTANQVAAAAKRLADGTLAELSEAMEALSSGDLDRASASVDVTPVEVRTKDEFGEMAVTFNRMQGEAARVALSLDVAASELRAHRDELERLVAERTEALTDAYRSLEEAESQRRALLDRMRELTSRIGRHTGEDPDLDATVRAVTEALGSVLGVDGATLQLAGPEGRLGDVVASWCSPAVADSTRFSSLPPAVRAVLDDVAERHETLAIADARGRAEELGDDELRRFVEEGDVGALLICPFYAADATLLGMMTLGRVGEPHSFTEDDVALVETVTADLARAVVSSRLIADQRRVVLQLRDLDRTRGEMLSTFSHELRTPLASIRAYVELLQEGETATLGGPERMLEVIQRNTTRLSSLIEDILTLSHLNSEVFSIELVPMEFDPLLASVGEALAPSATGKELDFVVRPGADCAMVLGDAAQLERLLFNLLSNAVKFTPAGGRVEVTSTCSPSEVVLTVSDSGIGIPPDELEQVYGRFYRGSNATNEVIPGTGLGLAIVKAIVEHHQGTMMLTSELGSGTTVRVGLPAVAIWSDPPTAVSKNATVV